MKLKGPIPDETVQTLLLQLRMDHMIMTAHTVERMWNEIKILREELAKVAR